MNKKELSKVVDKAISNGFKASGQNVQGFVGMTMFITSLAVVLGYESVGRVSSIKGCVTRLESIKEWVS